MAILKTKSLIRCMVFTLHYLNCRDGDLCDLIIKALITLNVFIDGAILHQPYLNKFSYETETFYTLLSAPEILQHFNQ